MKFKIDRSNFFKTLSHLQGIVDKKNNLPILSNILIEAKNNSITLTSTDMDISIIDISISVDDKVKKLPFASIKILDRMGRVFFLSTIPCK